MASFLVTGGTGFIGRTLVASLVDAGHEVVVITRNPDRHAGSFDNKVRYIGTFGQIDNKEHFQVVINLGGEGIGDKRWSEKRKQVLLNSRIGLTEHLVKCLARLETRPAMMISGSAVGWYGSRDDQPLSEDSAFNDEFTHELCQQWEQAAMAVQDLGIRLCIVRLGIVLGEKGGVLKRLLPPFSFGLGGRLGDGKQMMSWIHLDDVIKAMNFLINENDLEGVFNVTAPHAVTNSEFTHLLGKAISRPTLFPMPAFMVKILFGEMGDRLLLQGQNVIPKRLQESGYQFEYPLLAEAFSGIFSK